VIDETDRVVAEKRLPNDLAMILAFLLPWQDELKQTQKRLRLICAAASKAVFIPGRGHDNNRSLLVADLVLIIRLTRQDPRCRLQFIP
jgi:hypothetical protein